MGEADSIVGLRERKKVRTEQTIQDVALRLAVEHGFEQVTVEDIASEVEVSKATFYRYFTSKEEALTGKPTENLDRMRAALDTRPASEPVLVAVRNALIDFIDSLDTDRVLLLRGRLIEENPSLAALLREHQAAWETLLTEFLASRLGDDPDIQLRSRIIAGALIATLRATMDHWRDTGGRADLHELMVTSLSILAEQRADLAAHP